MRVVIEACVGSLESVRAAIAGGASRVELCARLDIGGTTPDAEFVAESVALCRAAGVTAMVIVRCRGGDFVYSHSEIDEMVDSIASLAHTGVDGFVVGALKIDTSAEPTPTGDPVYVIDEESLSRFIHAAPPAASFTFHRAFDSLLSSLPPASADERTQAALQTIYAAGCDRVLTSGGAPTASAGLSTLITLSTLARALPSRAGRPPLRVIPGSGVGSGCVGALASALLPLGVSEFHGTFKRPPGSQSLDPPAPADETDAEEVAAVVAAVAAEGIDEKLR